MGRMFVFRYISVLMCVVSFCSCSVNHGKPCIEQEKMSDILVDAYMAPSALYDIRLKKGEKREYYFTNIFIKHGVTEAEFDSALTWYTSNMDQNKKLYDRVIEKLTARINEIESEQ